MTVPGIEHIEVGGGSSFLLRHRPTHWQRVETDAPGVARNYYSACSRRSVSTDQGPRLQGDGRSVVASCGLGLQACLALGWYRLGEHASIYGSRGYRGRSSEASRHSGVVQYSLRLPSHLSYRHPAKASGGLDDPTIFPAGGLMSTTNAARGAKRPRLTAVNITRERMARLPFPRR